MSDERNIVEFADVHPEGVANAIFRAEQDALVAAITPEANDRSDKRFLSARTYLKELSWNRGCFIALLIYAPVSGFLLFHFKGSEARDELLIVLAGFIIVLVHLQQTKMRRLEALEAIKRAHASREMQAKAAPLAAEPAGGAE